MNDNDKMIKKSDGFICQKTSLSKIRNNWFQTNLLRQPNASMSMCFENYVGPTLLIFIRNAWTSLKIGCFSIIPPSCDTQSIQRNIYLGLLSKSSKRESQKHRLQFQLKSLHFFTDWTPISGIQYFFILEFSLLSRVSSSYSESHPSIG